MSTTALPPQNYPEPFQGELGHLTFTRDGRGGYVVVDNELGGEVRIFPELIPGSVTILEDALPETPAAAPGDDLTLNLSAAIADPNITAVHSSRAPQNYDLGAAGDGPIDEPGPVLVDGATGRPVTEDEMLARAMQRMTGSQREPGNPAGRDPYAGTPLAAATPDMFEEPAVPPEITAMVSDLLAAAEHFATAILTTMARVRQGQVRA